MGTTTTTETTYTPPDFAEPEVSETIDFTDTSTGATEWLWDFGDGTTSVEQNPSHTYNVAGEYQVTLTVSNEWGSDTITQTVIIEQSEMETDDDDNGDDDNDDDDNGDDDKDDDDKDDDGDVIADDYLSLIESGWTTTQGRCSAEQKQRGCRSMHNRTKCVCPPEKESTE